MAHARKASEQYRIALVRQATGCAAWEARNYLEAEEWDVADAVLSYKADAPLRAQVIVQHLDDGDLIDSLRASGAI